MKYIAVFVILFLFFNLAQAQTPVSWNLIEQVGDDYQIFIDINFTVQSIQAFDEITEDSGLTLSENNTLPGQNFAIGCIFGNVLTCVQPNETYIFLIEDDNNNQYTVVFRTNSSGEIVPFVIFNSSQIISEIGEGVRDTTAPLAPLLAFVGVPVAFFIGRGLIGFIKNSI